MRSSTTHFADAHLSVATESVSTPARPTARTWTIVRRKPAVVVAPMTADHKFVLIRQERIPIRQTIWEMPAGQADEFCHCFEDVALRELREETGYELASGGELLPLGHFFSSPGFTDEVEYLFLARPVKRTPTGHSRSEAESIIDCREFSFSEITRMIAEGIIRDANTLSICAQLLARNIIT